MAKITRKLQQHELEMRNKELADNVCQREECLERKANFNAGINKEIKHHTEIILQIAREINAGEVTESEPVLPMEAPNGRAN